jgi:hypothetical protein
VCNGPFEVIDHRNQVLEEILGAVLGRFLALAQRALAEILELGLEAQQAILVSASSSRSREATPRPRPPAPARHRRPLALRPLAADRRPTVHRLAQRGLELGIDRDRPALVVRVRLLVALPLMPGACL